MPFIGADSWLLNSSRGFTLLELLAVFVIIAVLAGAVLGITKYAATNAAVSRTKAEIATMEAALESYKNDNGTYPTTLTNRVFAYTNSPAVYKALVGGPKQYFTFKPYQILPSTSNGNDTNIIDAFGKPYNYYCYPGAADQTNQVTFDLWSYGPDGQNDTADDIVNWRR